MTKILHVWISLSLSILSITSIMSQCPAPFDNFQNFANYDLTPTVQGVAGTKTSYSTWGNDYHKVDVVAGEKYEISTCGNVGRYNLNSSGWGGTYPIGHASGFGGQGGYDINWNPQITLMQSTTAPLPNNIEGFNDDFCGVFPKIIYTASFTGELWVLLDSATVCNQYEVDSIQVDVTWLVGCSDNISSFPVVACGSYTVPSGDETYSVSGIYKDTIPNAEGCDSVMTINVTVNNNAITTNVLTSCNTYVWRDGVTYTSSNSTASHIVNGAASNGCDSVYTLNLTINNSNTGLDTQVACNSYTWIDGNVYTSSNNSATHTLTNVSGCDSVVTLNLTINNSNTGVDTQVACNSYTWIDGNVYTSSNNSATHTLTNVSGCDSVVTLNLTINNSNTGVDTQVACNSYTWIDGNVYTSSNNSATHTLTNVSGCDSVVTLNLTINNSNTGVDTQVACNSYTWIDGNVYTSSNNSATYTLTNVSGCDSVVTLNLTINNSNTGVDTQVACNSYTWIDGNVYTSSNNSATHTLTNVSGCDSVVTLNLTINNSNTGVDTQVACNSYTWIDGNVYTSSNNSATHTLTNVSGCDSVVTLNLTINNSNTGVDTQVACNSYTWIDGNVYTSSNNSATYTLTNVSGCDSVVTLNLTINNSNTGLDTQVACNSYTWIDGNVYTSSNNSATYTLTNVSGCDSIVTLDLTIEENTINVMTSLSGLTITSNEIGASYQWINCDGNVTITGESNQSYVVDTNGDYAVIISEGVCSDTSACISIQDVGFEDLNGVELLVYPNPTQKEFYIESNVKGGMFNIYSIDGKSVRKNIMLVEPKQLITLENEVPGVYFIEIFNDSNKKIIRLVLE